MRILYYITILIYAIGFYFLSEYIPAVWLLLLLIFFIKPCIDYIFVKLYNLKGKGKYKKYYPFFGLTHFMFFEK